MHPFLWSIHALSLHVLTLDLLLLTIEIEQILERYSISMGGDMIDDDLYPPSWIISRTIL